MRRIGQALFGADYSPYAGHRAAEHPGDLQGWNSTLPIFGELLAEIRPSLIVEVGTWKGASAVHMAQEAKRLGLEDVEIVCVDTWLGSADMFNYSDLRRLNGYPQVYFTFLTNVIEAGVTDLITPFPIASSAAALTLQTGGIKADLVYIDGAHDAVGVHRDLFDYWPIVRDGGVLFGDDYDRSHPQLQGAVEAFFRDEAHPVIERDGKFIVMRQA